MALGFAPATFAQSARDRAESAGDTPAEVSSLEEPTGESALFSIDSLIGPIEYSAGRGLSFGWTGLNVGGFTTVEFEREDHEPGLLALDSLNFLVLFEPVEYFRGFAELEIGELFSWETDKKRVDSTVELEIERLFGDITLDDPFALRFGKFQTPIGRWNLVPAEPFVWTPEEPVVLETAFDESTTGVAVLGSIGSRSGTLNYWVYGQVVDPLDPEEDAEDLHRSVGARLEFDRSASEWSIGGSFLASERKSDWSMLGGLDATWRHGPFELSTEALYQRGDIEDRDIWDVFVQGVYEVLPGFHLVGRYEHYHPIHDINSNVVDLGIAWIPRHYLHLKGSYRLTDDQSDEVRRGLKIAFSVLF